MNIKLSICIPTYNRAKYLCETLESIVSQAGNDIEIVIVDGASIDNTEEVVSRFKKRFSNLIYHRREMNMGVDKDMAKTVELARGDYCWLMSSDDVIKTGAIKLILDEIKQGYQIYLCNRIDCDSLLKPFKDTQWLASDIDDAVYDLSDKTEIKKYFDSAISIGALFSFMSSIIFCRCNWISVKYNELFTGTGYAHVYTLLSFVHSECKLKYIKSPLVFCRLDNDSFSNNGIVSRFMLDFEGYLRLADALFGKDKDIKNSFLKVMTREHKWYRILKVRSYIRNAESWKQIEDILLGYGYNPKTLVLCDKFGKYKKLIASAVNLKKQLTRKRYGT